MRRLVAPALFATVAIVQSMNAAEILSAIERAKNPAQLMQGILCPSGTFDVDQARRFIFHLKQDVKSQYGLDLDLNLVIDEAIRTMFNAGEFSEEEIETARAFYSQLIDPESRVSNSWKFWKRHKSEHKNKRPEFMLPDKMAVGFICIFSGALLCILPFGRTQGIGTGLIGTGIYSVIDGVREGEKPYYIDSKTGHPIPSNNQGTILEKSG
jgi:hypothetical protein